MQTRLALPDHFAVTDIIRQDHYALTMRATDRRSEKEVILKALRPLVWLNADETAARRTRAQTRLALLPCIATRSLAKTNEITLTDNSVVLSRDYISAPSLRSLIDHGMRLSVEATANMGAQVARALDALAANGIAHGAVKPENVFLFADGTARLTDPMFGVESRIVPLAGVRCASAPPEHHRGDIDALASLLFEALTGIPATRGMAASVARAYHLPSQTRHALARAISGSRSQYTRAAELAASLLPVSGSSLFRAVWQPAAAAGLLGALATLGGYAYSEMRQPTVTRVYSPRQIAIDDTLAIKPLNLTEDDQSILRLAYRRLGPAALAKPVIGEILQLTERQRDRIMPVLAAQRRRIETLVESAGSGSDTASAMRTIRESNGSALLQILDPSQRAAWEAARALPSVPGEPIL